MMRRAVGIVLLAIIGAFLVLGAVAILVALPAFLEAFLNSWRLP